MSASSSTNTSTPRSVLKPRPQTTHSNQSGQQCHPEIYTVSFLFSVGKKLEQGVNFSKQIKKILEVCKNFA